LWRKEEAVSKMSKKEGSNLTEKLRKLERRADYFSALLKVSTAISSEIDLDDVLQSIVRKTQEITETDICSLRLLEGGWLVLKASVGHSNEYLHQQRKLRVGESLAGLAVKEKRMITTDLTQDKLHISSDLMRKVGMKSFLCVPLMFKKKATGALSVYSRKKIDYLSQDAKDFMLFLAEQCAVALENARLYEEAREAYISSIAALSSAIDARDEYTAGHSQEVAKYACVVGRELGLSPKRLKTLEYAALLHDIGKIGIPDYILLKPSSLTDSEWQIIKTHPHKGEEILKPLHFLKDVILFVRQHQERYDGKGYPNGLSKEKISLEARILGAVDAYQAMTSTRPYRGAYSKEEAIKELKDKSGTQFDPVVVDAFLRALEKNTKKKVKSL
jgi:putative nucleotidyltransferase with HDIG domain